jgi:hypothetical protein
VHVPVHSFCSTLTSTSAPSTMSSAPITDDPVTTSATTPALPFEPSQDGSTSDEESGDDSPSTPHGHVEAKKKGKSRGRKPWFHDAALAMIHSAHNTAVYMQNRQMSTKSQTSSEQNKLITKITLDLVNHFGDKVDALKRATNPYGTPYPKTDIPTKQSQLISHLKQRDALLKNIRNVRPMISYYIPFSFFLNKFLSEYKVGWQTSTAMQPRPRSRRPRKSSGS